MSLSRYGRRTSAAADVDKGTGGIGPTDFDSVRHPTPLLLGENDGSSDDPCPSVGYDP